MKNLLGDEPPDEALAAELDVHDGLLHLWHDCDGEAALKRLERAKARDSLKSGLVALRVDYFTAAARHFIGQGELAVASLQEQIRSLKDPESLAYLMRALTFVRLLSGDLHAAERDAERAIDLAKRGGNPMLEGMSYYLRANSQFQAHQFSHALPNFVESAKKRIVLNRRLAIDALAGQVLTCQVLHRFNDALVALEELVEMAKETGDLHHLTLAESSRARLSLLQNDVEVAVRWANAYDGELVPSDTLFFLEVPVLTQCRAWIASGTRENLSRALGRLRSVRRQVEALHFTPQMIEALVLEAVALEKKGSTDEAHAALDEAIALGAPRGFVRPFIEGGATMAAMLDGRRSRSENRPFTHRLLAAFESGNRPPSSDLPPVRRHSLPGAVESLTNRQIEILELLRKRFRDKEIAAELVISPATVHQHLKQIYRKLGVNDRRHAVEKAKSLGILGSAVK
jgi:LuxR family maltose regulon positive regulatory protein